MSKQWWFAVDRMMPSEKRKRPGKPEWQDSITLRLTYWRALDLIRQLAAALAYDKTEPYDVQLPGELVEETDDEG